MGRYITPPTLPVEKYCRELLIPNSPEWIGTITGALLPLMYADAWEKIDGIEPQEAADAVYAMLVEMWAGDGDCEGSMNCADVLSCMLPWLQSEALLDAAIRLDPITEEPQVSYDGGVTWTDIPDTGTGIQTPTPTPTPGSDDDARMCLASTRAALVIAEFYKQTFGAFTADVLNTLGGINNFLHSVNMALFNAIYSPYEGVIEAVGWFEFDFATNYTAGELTEEQVEELTCLLLDNASVDSSGIVSFNHSAVMSGLTGALGTNPGVAVALLVGNMQSAGLQSASNVNVTEISDCDPCEPEWCRTFDFGVSEQGWSLVPSYGGQWLGSDPAPVGNGWYSTQKFTSPVALLLAIYIDFTRTKITGVDIEYRTGQAADGGYRAIDLFDGVYTHGSEVEQFALTTGATGSTVIEGNFTTSVFSDRVRVWIDTDGTNVGSFNTIKSVTLHGRGTNPFGTDNC